MKANPGKELQMTIHGQEYLRIPIRTKMIYATDDIVQVAQEYATDHLQEGDILVVSEKAVAITQGRVYHRAEIKASRLAKILSKFVYKSPHGRGLGDPETMEVAIREAGAWKIILAGIIGVIGKLFGIRGLFYRICGHQVRSIDGPSEDNLEPYKNCIVLGPKEPHLVARRISEALDCAVAVIDANDLGVNVLGVSGPEVDVSLIAQLLTDNPLGQSIEQTPIGIIRRAQHEESVLTIPS